jgi:gliding motility-associated-like protein
VRLFGVPIDVEARFESADSTYFSIALPQRLGAGDSGGVIEVVFTAPVLRYGTTFGGWIRDTERPLELPQRIVPGDAAIELVSEELTVRTTLSDRLLADLQVEPRKFTPNGDGINDRVRFAFNLLQLTNEAPLNVRLFDLSGRLLKVVHDGGQESGKLNFFWDGRDESGALVAPGIYLYRIEIEAEEKNVEQFGTVAVVY